MTLVQPLGENDIITFIVNLDLVNLTTVTTSFANMKHDDWNNLRLKYPDICKLAQNGEKFWQFICCLISEILKVRKKEPLLWFPEYSSHETQVMKLLQGKLKKDIITCHEYVRGFEADTVIEFANSHDFKKQEAFSRCKVQYFHYDLNEKK